MAPRPVQKRRAGDDDSSSGRHAKRSGKNKREVTYDTYEEAMDGGVDFEEKGERYRDGDRAQRNYERSLELYQKAHSMELTYDAAYNQARVLYTLATAFFLPPVATEHLAKSIELYRQATSSTESPLLQLDAGFNLAQSCTTLADMLEDFGGEGASRVQGLREEAAHVLQQVMDGQEEYLTKMAEEADAEATEEVVDGVEGGAEAPSAAEVGMEVDPVDESATYETHLPTPSALIDTVLALIDVHLSLWTSADPLQPPGEPQQMAVRTTLDRAATFCTPGRQAELDLAEMQVLLTMDGIIWDLFKTQATVGSGSLQSLEGASAALTRLHESLDTQPPDEKTVRAEILTTIAECHTKIANRSMYLSTQLPAGPNPMAQQAWFHHSQAIAYLTTALDLPLTPDTPKEFRPSVLLELSKGSLSRARLATVNETAQRNLAQFVENATTYAGRAGEALGLRWLKLDTPAAAVTKVELPPPRGWDMEALGREVMLQQIRVCLYASEMELSIGVKGRLNEGMSRLVDHLQTLGPSRRLHQQDLTRWIEGIEDEEAGISDTERTWWARVTERVCEA